MFDSAAHWIQNLPLSTAVREGGIEYPIVLTTHLACIAVFGGMILFTDLRLLDLVMRNQPVSDVIRPLRIYKRIGLVIMLTCGVLLASAKAQLYFANPYFWAKMSLLVLIAVHALYFRRSVYSDASGLDGLAVMPMRAKVAGALSLVLWLGVLCNGRLIAYYDAPPEPVNQVASSSR